ncbi:MAG: hypothetical protein OEZ06_04745 [Myxococcales bacterium]|nr:hypothetical protein [Myxococcales bacterium]
MSDSPQPRSIRAVAYNQVPESENAIHSDEVAKQHGFRGGLVPGVTVSAYLADPGVRAWGRDFLQRGRAQVVVEKPLYDGDDFEVKVLEAGSDFYEAELHGSDAVLCARGRFELPVQTPEAPTRRGDRRAVRREERPAVSREVFDQLRAEGMGWVKARWEDDHAMRLYFRHEAAMPEVLRPSGGGLANLGFVLGMTNWVLAANVKLGPWLHLQTESQCYAAIESGQELIVEAAVVDLFERKGHAFVDLDVAAFVQPEDRAVMSARLRAIYRLRGTA